MASQEIETLSSALARLPGLGPRSARRAVLWLVKRRDQALPALLAVLGFGLALALFVLDTLIVLYMAGGLAGLRRRAGRGAAAAALVATLGLATLGLAVALAPAVAHAQDSQPSDEQTLQRLDTTHLAYVITGEQEVDRLSEQGLIGLGRNHVSVLVQPTDAPLAEFGQNTVGGLATGLHLEQRLHGIDAGGPAERAAIGFRGAHAVRSPEELIPSSSPASRITDAQIDELERLNDALADAVDQREPDLVAQAVFAFHRTLNRSTGRIKLAWFLLHAARYLPVRIYATDPQWGAATVANHRELVAALRDRDIDEVVRQTRRQFDDAAERLTGRLDELGLWPA